MSNLYAVFGMSTIWFVVSVVFLLIISFLVKQVHQLKSQIFNLENHHEKKQSSSENSEQNPLGELFSPSTKTLTIGIKKNGSVTYASDSLLKLLGYSKKQLIGKNVYGLLMPEISRKEQLEMNLIKRIFQNPKLYTEHETEFLTKTGQKVWISWTNRILKDKSGKAYELRSVGLDISNRKKLEEQLQFIASKDPQTGCLNKISLLEIGTRELKRSMRYHHDFSVLALRLISLNKTLSPQQIEEQLKQIVSLCRKTIRDVDYLGRVGEAEFILLLPETQEKNVPFLQKRLQQHIDEYNQKTHTLALQISFGSSAYTENTKSIDELISKALANIKKGKQND